MADAGATKKKSHYRALDGCRGFGILAVMFGHWDQKWLLNGGYVGVDLFFVLSGFLITSLLLSEHRRTGRVSFKMFYARRALRLLPALFVVAAASAVIVVAYPSMVKHGYRHDTLLGLPFVIFYVGNWFSAITGATKLGLLNATWTLAIEEQFYLLWPLLLLFLRRRLTYTRIAYLLIGGAVLEWILRFGMALSHVAWERTYYATVTHSDGLMLGCAMALLIADDRIPARWARNRALPVVAGVVALLIAFGGQGTEGISWTVASDVAVVCACGLILSLLHLPDTRMSKVLGSRIPVWLGQRSYGLYLIHAPIYITLGVALSAWPRNGPNALGFVISFPVAWLLYRYIEAPALRLKNRFDRGAQVAPAPSARADTTPAPAGAAGVEATSVQLTPGAEGLAPKPTAGG